jgi:hypothetical protein
VLKISLLEQARNFPLIILESKFLNVIIMNLQSCMNHNLTISIIFGIPMKES